MSSSVDELLAAAVQTVPNGVARSGQQEMAQAVSRAFDSGKHLLVQAGTGTGKSLGYLVPALQTGKRTVIATATIALQSQLIAQDLPRLTKALKTKLGTEPRYALLKGRQHYVCLAKLDDSNSSESLFDGDDGGQWLGEISKLGAAVNQIRDWAKHSETGDRAELDSEVDDRTWRHVSMRARECVGAARCPFGTDCFAEKARETARQADVIVTNHALLAIDMTQDGQVLPEHDLLVVDEAHELSSHVTSAARAELVPEIVTRAARLPGLNVELRDRLGEAADALVTAIGAAPLQRLRPMPAHLAEVLTLVAAAARDASAAIGTVDPNDSDVVSKNQTKQSLRELHDTAQRLAADSVHDVVWVDEDDRGRRGLVVAPLSVAALLGKQLFANRTVVLTSATLTAGGQFEAAARGVGLSGDTSSGETVHNWEGLDVGSPFDYARQGILYVAAHLPRPAASGLSDAAGDELVELVTAAGGRTLGLFSSRKAAGQAAEILRSRTTFSILVQGEDSLSNLVQKFRDEVDSCLLGVMSLWQGVDVPGPSCQLVVVDRLPFPRPDDPLFSARTQLVDDSGGSGFMSVSIPHAAVRLAQGSGRLIRSTSDKGVVAVLDSRLHHARYGDFIRRTLPPFWYTTSSSVVRNALTRLAAETASE